MKKYTTFVSHAFTFLCGMVATIVIYRLVELPMVQPYLQSAYGEEITVSGSFLIDWPLDILFPVVPALLIVGIIWGVLKMIQWDIHNS